ncbi:MAG TPA: serine/threonine-protein kinase [Kofleriaceae bacterium]|nr:serine/threonine-protein kinase [Kofleriaceae bacterium]
MSSIATELQDRYEILARLGEGSMGEVYLVKPRQGGARHAIKVLRLVADRESEARFKREASAMNRLRHPNIVAVHGLGALKSGRLYFSMEYAHGGSVRDLLKQCGRVDSGRTAHILLQLADAIDHAHASGVIHRDLKPTNLILTSKDHVPDFLKVLDFGVAKIIAPDYADSLRTSGNIALGTPAYMAPELLENGRSDTRIDIYSLGCIAFELLTGRPPFIGRAMEVFHQHIHEPAPRASQRAPDAAVHPVLDDLIARCLAKDPADRPATGGDVADALRAVVAQRTRDMRRWAATPPEGVATAGGSTPAEGPTIRIDTSAFRSAPDPAAAVLTWQMAVRELAEILARGDADGSELRVALRRAVLLDEQRVKLVAERQLAAAVQESLDREIALVAAQSHVDDERDRAYGALDRIARARAAELGAAHAELVHRVVAGRPTTAG